MRKGSFLSARANALISGVVSVSFVVTVVPTSDRGPRIGCPESKLPISIAGDVPSRMASHAAKTGQGAPGSAAATTNPATAMRLAISLDAICPVFTVQLPYSVGSDLYIITTHRAADAVADAHRGKPGHRVVFEAQPRQLLGPVHRQRPRLVREILRNCNPDPLI